MINKIRAYFGWHTLDSLQTKSGSILDVFTKTTLDLASVNEHITNHVNMRDAAIKRLASEQDNLNDMKSANNKIIEKINSFLD